MLQDVIRKYWGFASLRPLQQEAMTAAIERRDSLVVLPTGGGKSLCYQAPALLSDKLTVVVSPLISLMKDQVDKLLARDIPAAFYNSSLDATDRRRVLAGVRKNEYKLLFVAPERFSDATFFDLLDQVGVAAFVIDEAHCISHWGHDFRVDYRKLSELKHRFKNIPVHTFTATATPRVRDDIIAQLQLNEPDVLVGDFFRPNLAYRVLRRTDATGDVVEAVNQRKGQPGIVYCVRRDDVDEMTAKLRSHRVRATAYHAGMSDDARMQAQDAFAIGETDVVVATVAFGMGIDRADIRYVIHAAMPKSIEHYQQETGRAGRDGKPAECILFYSGGDFGLWKSIIGHSEPSDRENKMNMLGEMYRYCTGATCRHQRLVSYFGQDWDRDSCGACDICNGSLQALSDSVVTSQKIMSCVVRTGQRYGAGYVADVLRGQENEKVVQRRHDTLSTFGLLADQPKNVLMTWIDQLVDQGLLHRQQDYRTLKVTPKGWQVLQSEAEAQLYEVSRPKSQKGQARSAGNSKNDSAAASSDVEAEMDPAARALFDQLRALRRQIADDKNVPAFMVFSDKTLREIARLKPASQDEFLKVKGVGFAKWESFGPTFIEAVRTFEGGSA